MVDFAPRSRLSNSMEDYLKQLYLLSEHDPTERVGTQEVAQALGVTSPSATGMLHKLHDLGLVDHQPYQGSLLSERGRLVAIEVLRHHRLLETFLYRTLGYALDELHEEAEALEHVISERFEAHIAALLGHPDCDPHGDPIPTPELRVQSRRGAPLSRLSPGHCARLLRVPDQGPLTRKLVELGLTPGVTLTLLSCDPALGTLTVQAQGGAPLTLALSLGEQIWAEEDKREDHRE